MWTNRKIAAVSGAAALALILAACAPTAVEGPVTTQTPVATASRAAVPSPPPAPTISTIWPLTGVDATDAVPEELKRPALSIKIENTGEARPQENLDAADIVFEEYVEYGISRLIAVFHSDAPESVGPIRSMRPMDKNIMGSIKGPLIFSGAQSRFITATVNSGQKVITQDRGDYGFYRTSDKPAPHNLHGRTADFFEQSAEMPQPPQQWAIVTADQEPTAAAGEKVSSIDINMSSVSKPSWAWNADDAVWERSETGKAMVTSDGTQIYANNVVVLWVKVVYTSAEGGSSVPETIVAGQEGLGFVVSGDSQIPIKWSKAGQFEPWVFTTEAGDPVVLDQGKTWVELIPNEGVGHSTSVNFS